MNLPLTPDRVDRARDIAYRFGTVSAEIEELATGQPCSHTVDEILAYAELAVADLRKIAEVAP